MLAQGESVRDLTVGVFAEAGHRHDAAELGLSPQYELVMLRAGDRLPGAELRRRREAPVHHREFAQVTFSSPYCRCWLIGEDRLHMEAPLGPMLGPS
jgi:hypothetical protein